MNAPIYSLIWLFLIVVSANPLAAQKTENYTNQNNPAEAFEISFDKRHHDFGKVRKGEKVSTKFSFVNTGKEDILIELVSACECTTLDWPRKAIGPGEKGSIDIIFDSTEKEESETIEVDINFKNRDPKTGYPRFEILSYSYELIK